MIGNRINLAAPMIRQEVGADAPDAPDGGRWVLFTSAVNRYGLSVDPMGMDITAMEGNAPVFFNHRSGDIPIGRLVDIQRTEEAMTAGIEFNNGYADAAPVIQSVKDGFLRAGSVGFYANDAEEDEDTGVIRITKSDLIEYSIVGTPADPTAIKQSVGDVRAAIHEQIKRGQSEPAKQNAAATLPALFKEVLQNDAG